jgi:hypothetical protein
MRIVRISAQSRQTLREFYEQLSKEPDWASIGQDALRLLEAIETTLDGPDMWATTSHQDFYLSDTDNYDPQFARVFVRFLGGTTFEVRFPVAASQAPWPGACVVGERVSIERTLDLVREALRRTGHGGVLLGQ